MKLLSSLSTYVVCISLMSACGGSQKAPEASATAPSADTQAQPDVTAPTDTTVAAAATTESAKAPAAETPSGPECKKDDDCTIFADCCSCKAVPAAKPSPVPCESVCGESKCEVKGITIANVACDAGRCVIKKK
jgi:hypothetical protein